MITLNSQTKKWLLATTCMIAASFIAIAACFAFNIISFSKLLAVAQNRSIELSNAKISIGNVVRGVEQKLQVEIKNNSSLPVSLLGAQSSCSCLIATNKFPLIIPAGTKQNIEVVIRGKGKPGKFREILSFYTDSLEYGVLSFEITGSIDDSKNLSH